MLGKAFNFHHEAFFVHADQADGVAFTARTACTADAVHVVFGDVGNFVVDDVGQLVNVDATGCNIGGHQGSQLAGLEARQGLRTCALALVAMQRHCGHAVLGQVLGHMVGAKFGACEHQHLAPVVLVNDVQQHFFFLGAAHRVDHLLDALHRRVAGRDLNALWVFEQVVGQGADVIAEGGGEQQALLVGRHQRQNFFDVVDKAHVQHAVGFVQHQHFNVGQIHEALLLQVEQAARGGDQHVHTLADAVNLGLHADATEDDRSGHIQVFGIGANVFFNLRRQLTGGREDQRTDAARRGLRAALCQAVQHGQRERGRLAGAGLGASQQVFACQHGGDRLCLNGSGGFVALLQHRFHDGGCQVQFLKCHCCRYAHPGAGYQPVAATAAVAQPVVGR